MRYNNVGKFMMANDLLQQAISAYKKGQRDLARDLLLRFVEDDKNNELSWLILADLVKDPADQIIALENALTINPNNARTYTHLEKLKFQIQDKQQKIEAAIQEAETAKSKGQYKEALLILRQLIEGGNGNEQIWMLISDLVPNRKSRINALQKVLSLNPDHSEARNRLEDIQLAGEDPLGLGKLYEDRGELEKAIDEYRWLTMMANSPVIREEAKRRLTSAKIRLQAPEFKLVKPQLTLARMTLGPILLFGVLMFLHSGLNLLKIPLALWIGWPFVALGSFLIVLTNEPSTAYILHTLWKSIGRGTAAPSLALKRLGILFITLPFTALIVESIIRFQIFWPLLWE
jgi:tetratricopeptide (TPR) repeat protein